MVLTPGTRLGVYEVTAQIGEGGMGQVYRATDSRLKRQVAIKILPPTFATDRDRVARFQREAEVLASLNHSNIAGIYGVEESGDITALVMEFVDGEDLSVRIVRGAMHLADALPIAKQIALALEAAHEQGIIHRDLKPANIKVRQDGTVKVLDFGLAKAMEPPAGSSPSLSMSPTLSIHATQAGIILGTAAYMSPEQARGRHVDRRADIWAFGAVLFEMLTGQQPFPGEDISHVLARVIEREPDWSALPNNLPPALVTYLRRCLVKDPRERIRDIGDVRLALEGAFDLPAAPERVAAPVVSRSRERLAWTAFGVVMLAALALAAWTLLRQTPAEKQTTFVVSPPEGWTLTTTPTAANTAAQAAPIAVSPDGRRIAFLASPTQGRSRLWVRSLDTLTAQELPGTDGASSPFWSPDSRSLGFFADGKLKRIDVAGGPPLPLCDAVDHRGGTWSRDGVIVFATSNHEPLKKVSAAGGVPVQVTTLAQGERGHSRPVFLPDGRHFSFYEYSANTIYIGSLDSPDKTPLLKGVDSQTVTYTQGHLLFLRGRTLMAQPFDARKLALVGEPVPVADQVQTLGNPPFGVFSASDTGLLVYQTGGPGRGGLVDRQLAWFDRGGKVLGTVEKPGQSNSVALSPDGARVAFSLQENSSQGVADVWVHEFARGTSTRFTFGPGFNWMATWSPDGNRIVWSSDRDDPAKLIQNLYQKASNGTGTDESLLKAADGTAKYAYDWSPDGHSLLYGVGGGRNIELWVLPLTGNERKPMLYLRHEGFNVSQARFSPDGRFVAYTSNASGRSEVYVQPFPTAAGGKWLVSQGGGNQPRWRRDGKELFYISDDSKVVAVPVTTTPTFAPGVPKPLFTAPIWGGGRTSNVTRYDVTADGQKFLINTLPTDATPQAASVPPMTVVLNWTAGLKE